MTKQALLIVGLVATTGVAYAAGHGRGERREGRGLRTAGRGNLVRLKEQLGLTDGQADQLRTLWAEQAKAHIRRRADVAVARLELRQLLAAPTVDERSVSAKARELGELQAAAVRARIDGHLAMRKVLNPEQQKKLRDLPPPRPPRAFRERRDGSAAAPDDGPDTEGASLTADEAR